MQQFYLNIQQELTDRLSSLKTSLIGREQSFKEWPGKAQVAIGVRRCGKTWLMYEKILSLSPPPCAGAPYQQKFGRLISMNI